MRLKTLLYAAPALLAVALPAQPGTIIGQFDAPDTPFGLGTGLAGELFMVSQSEIVYELSPTGSVLRQFSVAANTASAGGIASDGTNFYITDSSTTNGGRGVDVYDNQGAYLRTFAVSASFPAGICYNPLNQHLYITDRTGGAVVYEHDLAGNQVATISIQGTAPDGITFEPTQSAFWIVDAIGDTVDMYDLAWTPGTTFPGPQSSLGSRGRGCVSIGGALHVAVPGLRKIVVYDTTGTLASVESIGDGCPAPGIFYEQFTGTGTGDLTGRTIRFRSQGGTSWTTSLSGSYITNLGTNLNLGDDTLLRNQPLGFSWTIPGSPRGSTSMIDISANGWIGLNPNEIPDTGFAIGESGNELAKYERLAAWWDDLNPATGGAVYLNQLQNPQRAVITWENVPQFGMTDSNTAQLVLFANGDFQITWQAGCMDDALTGFSSGGSPADPGSIDLSMSVPGRFGPYGAALELSSERPVIGTTVNYRIINAPSSASFAGLLFGTSSPGTPLDAIGMEGCTLYSSADLAATSVALPAGTLSFAIPNDRALIGANVYHQGVVVAGGFTSLGVLATNGLKFRIGT